MNRCTVTNCPRSVVGKGLCSRHWQQDRKHGHVITTVARTHSPILEKDGHIQVGLLDVFDNLVGWTLISPEDVFLVRGKKLRSDKGAYAVFFGTRRMGYLHRALLPGVKEIDHVNGDGLDNRRENIRPATRSQNSANKLAKGTKGVRRRGNRYEAYISAKASGGKSWHYLGMYCTKEEAALAYNRAAREQWGEFARLNTL